MKKYAIIDRGRGPELEGTRVTVYNVVPYLLAGHSATYIAACMNLSTAAVQTLIDYIEAHKEEVMEVHWQIEARIARGNPPEIMKRFEEAPTHKLLHARWEEFKRKRAEQEANGESDPPRQ